MSLLAQVVPRQAPVFAPLLEDAEELDRAAAVRTGCEPGLLVRLAVGQPTPATILSIVFYDTYLHSQERRWGFSLGRPRFAVPRLRGFLLGKFPNRLQLLALSLSRLVVDTHLADNLQVASGRGRTEIQEDNRTRIKVWNEAKGNLETTCLVEVKLAFNAASRLVRKPVIGIGAPNRGAFNIY